MRSHNRWLFPLVLALVVAPLVVFALAHKYNNDRIIDAATESIIEAGF